MVVLDLSMPGMSGEETLTALRAVDDKIPIVIMSGHASLQSDASSGADFQDYLRKPFSAEGLLRLLDYFL